MARYFAKHSPLFILAGLCIAMAVYSADFRKRDNLQNAALRTSEVGIIAIGQLLVILTGGIDLSVGSVAGLAGVAGCLTMKTWGFPVPAGIAAGILVGLACGLTSGLLVTKGRLPPFIATLGMMMVARGFCLILSGAVPVFGLPPAFAWLGGTKAWWIPVALTVIIAAAAAIMLSLTRLGRAMYAIGGNLPAARLSGISVDAVRITAFAVSGALAGFAGMVLASRSSVASPNAGEMYELDAIAACVIGGASLSGGRGGAIAALAGALIMSVLRNFCNLEDINVYWQQVFVGALVVMLVFYDNHRKRRTGLLLD